MSVPQSTPSRTSQDVQNEYNNLAFKAGHLQYEIGERERNLVMINDALRTLSTEFLSLKTREDEVAKAVAAAAAPSEAKTPPNLTSVPAGASE